MTLNLTSLPADTQERCLDVFAVHPKPEQLEVVAAMARGEDCILIAGCGWGKSLVYFLPLVLWPNKVILLLSPLKALAEEQQQKLEKLQIRSIALTGESEIGLPLLQDLACGLYRAVFLSPELIFSGERIGRLWHMHSWRERLLAVVVDEAHCISTWGGDFRKDYGRIGDLRAMVPKTVAFLALSATLPPATLATVRRSLHFEPGARIINVGNDRPNIKYVVSNLQHPLNSYQDLKFLLDFRKTIVYFQGRPEAEAARKFLVQLLDDPSDSSKIAVYHSVKSDDFKREVLEGFRVDRIRLLLATEAVGMGCDINDIVRVVQYGLPSSISSLIQRLGRAARDPGLQGLGLLLVPRTLASRRRPVNEKKDPELTQYIETKDCRRRVLNNIFGNEHRNIANCCDICHPEPQAIVEIDEEERDGNLLKAASARVPSLTAEEKDVARQAIRAWRLALFER